MMLIIGMLRQPGRSRGRHIHGMGTLRSQALLTARHIDRAGTSTALQADMVGCLEGAQRHGTGMLEGQAEGQARKGNRQAYASSIRIATAGPPEIYRALAT